jgi:NADH-quinone oxidoreductase subunit C
MAEPTAANNPAEFPEATPQAVFGVDAVKAALATHPAVRDLGDLLVDAKWDRQELTLTVEAANIVAACRRAQDAGYNFFEDVTAVDWYPSEPRFQVSYSLLSHKLKQRIRLAVRVPDQGASVPSITGVWPAANFYEREVFDLFGIDFPGHPRLTRIMMPDNWTGHPLRKDYPVEGYR